MFYALFLTELSLSSQITLCGAWFSVLPQCSAVKNQPATQEPQKMQVQSLDWEDPLDEGMATHSSILAWRIPRTEEPGGL